MYKWCAGCNSTRSGDFCYSCGSRLLERIKCECGEVLHPVDKYCSKCGKRVDKTTKLKEAV